jgi:hypothetical protein
MKSQIFLSLLVFTFFFSCKKDIINTEPANEPPRNVEHLILDFKARLDATLKEGTTYAADSAVWYVEALLNYSYGNASVQCRDFTVHIAEITLNTTGSEGFTLEQLLTVFAYLEDDVLTNQPENTNIYAIDVYTYPENGQTVFAARTAYATPITPQYKASLDTAGYWYWGAGQGMCGPDSGLYIGMDATDIIEDIINATGPTNDYFTDLETLWTWGKDPTWFDPNFPFTDPCLVPRRIFNAYGPWECVLFFCMSPDLIHYYASTEGIPYVIDSLHPDRKEFIYIDIVGGVMDELEALHEVNITYGKPIN